MFFKNRENSFSGLRIQIFHFVTVQPLSQTYTNLEIPIQGFTPKYSEFFSCMFGCFKNVIRPFHKFSRDQPF